MNDLRKAYRTTMLIGLWMMGGVFIYAIVVEFVKSRGSSIGAASPMPSDDILRYVLLGIAAVIFFLIRVINNHFLAGDVRIPGTGAASRYSPDIQRLMTAAVITFALCESIAVLGLVLFFLGGSPADFYVFMLISLFFFSVYFPKYGRWEEWMRERGKTAGKAGG
jgi:F0F1-type ATP synthase membrane subunit c/vacuolar-type H+-ATPase subunit K